MITRHAISSTLALLLGCAIRPLALAQAPVPATQPTEAADPRAIASLIQQLGDVDPKVRDVAGKSLWSMGRVAEPALRQAAAGDDPEIARRAKVILRDFTYGLYPDAPRELFTLVDAYRKGNFADKRNAALGLSAKGLAGLRVLLKLRDEERDPATLQVIAGVLGSREHDVSVLMLANGQAAEVERMLENSANSSPVAAQDYAALLLTNGKLAARFAELKAQPLTHQNAPLMLALARAAGDDATARAAAEKSGNTEWIEAVMVQQRDWKGLAASRRTPQASEFTRAEHLGYLCAYQRLAGDRPAYEASVKLLVQEAAQHPEESEICADDLFLNDVPEQATSILLQFHDYARLLSFLAPRLQLHEALDLPKLAAQNQPGALMQVRARTVGTLQFTGQIAEAKKLMAQVARENELQNDQTSWVYLIEAARAMGMKVEADTFAITALSKATRQDPVWPLLEKCGFSDGLAAAAWWQFFRSQYATESVKESLDRLHSLLDGKLSGKDLDGMSDLAHRYAANLSPPEREQWQQRVSETFATLGRVDLARQWNALLETSSNAFMLIHAGDFQAEHKNWTAAIADYSRAWEQDHAQAGALFLHGWALSQSGHAKEGAALMGLAHIVPLGNVEERESLLEALSQHKLPEEVERERDLIIRATPPHSFVRNEALRLQADDLSGKGEYMRAADLWEQVFLQNLSSRVSFSEPWAFVVVPSLIHKTRAMGLIKSGQIDAALEQADLAMKESPADTDGLIEVVNALDNAGHKPEADGLFARHTAIYRKTVADFPNSGPLHNQLSWAQVMCHRELDDALKNGLRAVELEPNSTASLDTLAEVYFARGDAASAIVQMKRCLELEPNVERHRQQIERFSKGK